MSIGNKELGACMKFPKEIILTLRGGNKLHIELKDQVYYPLRHKFTVSFDISDILVMNQDVVNKKTLVIKTEEKTQNEENFSFQ